MPRAPKDIPETLRPYISNGVGLKWESNGREATADCPFCNRDEKFSVNLETGLYRCFICAEGTDKGGGNAYTFIRHLHAESMKETRLEQYADLVKDRKILSVESLRAWGCCRSVTTGNWILPGYGPSGEICQLYSYIRNNSRMIMLPTPTLGHQMFGLTLPLANTVWITEGPWDGVALWEIMGLTGMTSDGLAPSNNGNSLLATTSVIAISSCGAVGDPFLKYVPMLAGKTVNLCFDNDHPRKNPKTEELEDPAGWLATKRALMLLECDTPPKQINFLKWGSNDLGWEGVNLELPDGYDVRDLITKPPSRFMLPRQARIEGLGNLFSLVQPVPTTWINEAKEHRVKEQHNELVCRTCHSYEKLAGSWRQALNWTEGLDHAFPVMLACVTSTMMLGDQIWLRVLGPPGCLAGNTLIYDPTNGTKLSVRKRWRVGIPFSVWTRKPDGTVEISEAYPPRRYKPAPIYTVRFQSGRKIRVTAKHRFWNGENYVALRTILRELRSSSSYLLPSISEHSLLARTLDDLHYRQTVGGSQSGCLTDSCPYDELPHLVQVYDRGDVPSQSDVLELSQDNSDDLLEHRWKHIHTYSHIAHPSKLDYGSQMHLIQSELESVLHSSVNTCGRYALLYSSDGHIDQYFFQKHTDLGVVESVPWSIENLFGSDVHAECPQQNSFLFQPDQNKSGSLPLVEIKKRLDLLSVLKNLFGGQGGKQLQPDSRLSLSQNYLCGAVFQSLHRSYLFDRDQQYYLLISEKPVPSKISKLVRVVVRLENHLIIPKFDSIVEVTKEPAEPYYDFHVPETNNYWAEGVFNHNCGKTTIAEAIAVCKKYVKSVSTLKGMYSGAIDESGEDYSLINSAASKTLVVKDGDPLLQQPNLGQILSELRDIYDTVGRPNYRNKAKTREYMHKRMTLLLCGTASLRHLDDSELGERTLDCVVMKNIDDDLEDEVLTRIAHRSASNLQVEVNGKADTHYDGAMLKAMQLTGGYVEYLRERAVDLIANLTISDEAKYQCTRLGKFVAHLRARPSKKQKETVQREFASRLTSQFVRLAGCLAIVLNKTTVDNDVMRRVRRVAMDTSDGMTFKIVDYLRQNPEGGALLGIATIIMQSIDDTARLLQFLRHIEVVEEFALEGVARGTRIRYRLTPRMVRMWQAVHAEV